MSRTEPKVDRELLGRVASLTRGEQRWLRTVLQSVLTMEPPSRRADEEERPHRAEPRAAAREHAQEPGRQPAQRQDIDDLLGGEGVSAEDYPELADELKGIGDIADLLRESGGERRRFGEEIMRLFGGSEGSDEDEEEEDEGTHLN
jgi:hypothetical protein